MFLKNEDLHLFSENGYLILPLLSKQTIQAIQNLYENTKNESGISDKNFFTTIWSNNQSYKEIVGNGLKAILEPLLNQHLQSFKSVFANFMVKKAGENSQLHPHQDWSFTDEEKYFSITAWIPLIDVDEKNGALQVLPKSQLLNNHPRARFAHAPFGDKLDYISQNLMQSIPMKAGEVLMINSRTIHASPPNLSSEDRIAVSIVLIPQEAPMKHWVLDKENPSRALELDVQPDFFTKYSCFDYPDISVSKKEVAFKNPDKNLLEVIK